MWATRQPSVCNKKARIAAGFISFPDVILSTAKDLLSWRPQEKQILRLPSVVQNDMFGARASGCKGASLLGKGILRNRGVS